MTKRLQAVGNSSGIIIDKPILELLRITPETELDVSTDGERLIVAPLRTDAARTRKRARAQERTLKSHEGTRRHPPRHGVRQRPVVRAHEFLRA